MPNDNNFDCSSWIWKVNWCRKKRRPASRSWAWKEAEEAYQQYLRKNGDKND